MNDFLNTAEIDLVLSLQQEDLDTKVKASITAGVKDAFLDSKAKPIISYLAVVIPSLLKTAYGVRANSSLEKKLVGTKALYDNHLNGFIKALEGIGATGVEKLRTPLAFTNYPFGPGTWVKLSNVLYVNRAKLKKELSVDGWKYLRRLFSIAASEELAEDDLFFLQKKALFIPDKLLAKYLHSLDLEKDDVSTTLSAAQTSEAALTKKYFSSDSPKVSELKALQEKFPEKYKEWRKAAVATKKAAKAVIEEEFRKRKYVLVDVGVAKDLMKELGIPNPIDKAFTGLVGLGTTDSMLFSFHTEYGKPLDAVVGKNVTMNKAYTKDDSSYYCTHMPFISKTGIPVKVYTVDHRKKSSQRLHNGAREALNVLEDVRSAFSSAIKPILNGKFGNTESMAALVCKVIDETAGRIGNPGSERDAKTFGIHNLLVKHARLSKDKVILKYIGKKGIPQEHKVEDASTVKAISLLIEGRDKGQYIFSKDGERPVSPSTVGTYLKSTGFPASPHRFRKLWANKIFNELAFKGIEGKKLTEKQAKEKFLAAVEVVAKKLGQTEKNTSIKSYIDPVLMKRFWDIVKHKVPAVVQKAIDAMELQDPDGDE